MAKVVYSTQSLEDMQQINEYIEANWGGNIAKQVLKKMTSDIRRLEQFPLSGADLGRIINVPTTYRYLYSEKNYIFYRVEFDEIQIVRVLSERQDYIRQLFENGMESDDEDNLNNEK